MRPETILFVIGIRVSNSKCIYYFDMAKDKFLARNCGGLQEGWGLLFKPTLKLEAMTKSSGQKQISSNASRTRFAAVSFFFVLFLFSFYFLLRDIFFFFFLYIREIFTFVRVLVLAGKKETPKGGLGWRGPCQLQTWFGWDDDDQIKRTQSGLPCEKVRIQRVRGEGAEVVGLPFRHLRHFKVWLSESRKKETQSRRPKASFVCRRLRPFLPATPQTI